MDNIMTETLPEPVQLEIHPVTPDSWSDFETLFGERGACAGCWCMWWKMKRADFDREHGQGTRKMQKDFIISGKVPGLLAYTEGQPVGWCAIEPRESYPVLQRSHVLKPVDDRPVWSVTCFFVAKPYRHRGVTAQLLNTAVDYAWSRGATIIEGYPVEPGQGRMVDSAIFTGLPSLFLKAGFSEVLRRSKTRPIMRLYVNEVNQR